MAEKGVIFGETAAKTIVKTCKEHARRTVNEKPHRARYQQKESGGTVRDGIVRTVIGCGWYRIELGTFIGSPNDIASASGSAGCDPCLDVTGQGTSGCQITISAPASKVTGSGTIVTAYDMFSDKIPLIVGTDCLLAKTSGVATVWKIVNGYHEHVVKYEEDGSCCGPAGEWVTTRKKPTILIGHDCEWIDCEPCPSGSA